MRVFLAILFMSLAPSISYGETYKTLVQCAIEGPVYYGDFMFEPNLNNWTTVECDRHANRSVLMAPNFLLSFNGVVYDSRGITNLVEVIHRNGANCRGGHEPIELVRVNAYSQETRFPIKAELRYNGGKLVSIGLSNINETQSCQVELRPTL